MRQQLRDVFPAFGQFRYVNSYDIQAVKKVLSKSARLDQRLQLLVGCCDNPHIGLDRINTPDPEELPVL